MAKKTVGLYISEQLHEQLMQIQEWDCTRYHRIGNGTVHKYVDPDLRRPLTQYLREALVQYLDTEFDAALMRDISRQREAEKA